MRRHQSDHIGIWFEQRRRLGVKDNILLAHYCPNTQQTTQYIYHHRHMDGISCLIHRFDTLGMDYNKVPLSHDKAEPDNQQFKKIKRQSKLYTKDIKWRQCSENNQQIDDHLYTALFTEQQTHAIQQKSQDENVSFNTLLFWTLNKACAELLIEPGQSYSWLYPVSMRGAIDYDTPYSNYSSGFYVELTANTSLSELHQMIRHRLKSGQHWVSWREAKIAKYLPGFILRLLYRYISKRQFYAGSFSSLGQWSTATEDNGRWYICAPGTANYPVSNCSLIYNEKLSCTLKLHKSIVSSPSKCREVLERWSEHLLENSPPQTVKQSTVTQVIHSTMA